MMITLFLIKICRHFNFTAMFNLRKNIELQKLLLKMWYTQWNMLRLIYDFFPIVLSAIHVQKQTFFRRGWI